MAIVVDFCIAEICHVRTVMRLDFHIAVRKHHDNLIMILWRTNIYFVNDLILHARLIYFPKEKVSDSFLLLLSVQWSMILVPSFIIFSFYFRVLVN
jgi:hypothetical protein